MSLAIANGHFEVVLWLHAIRSEGFKPEIISTETGHLDFDCFSWQLTDHSEGHVNIVKWLCEKQFDGWASRAIDFAANTSRLDMMQHVYGFNK